MRNSIIRELCAFHYCFHNASLATISYIFYVNIILFGNKIICIRSLFSYSTIEIIHIKLQNLFLYYCHESLKNKWVSLSRISPMIPFTRSAIINICTHKTSSKLHSLIMRCTFTCYKCASLYNSCFG